MLKRSLVESRVSRDFFLFFFWGGGGEVRFDDVGGF